MPTSAAVTCVCATHGTTAGPRSPFLAPGAAPEGATHVTWGESTRVLTGGGVRGADWPPRLANGQ